MLYNYLLIAWRNLLKRKVYAAVNVFGLSLGISACMLVFALVAHLKSFDNFHPHADHTYRLVTDSFEGAREFYTPGVPAVLKEAFVQDFAGIDASVLISGGHNGLLAVSEGEQENHFLENDVAYTTDDFFEFFERKILKGNSNGILNASNQAVISKSQAEKLFGTEEAIGKTFQFQKGDVFAVTAVMEDFPDNTHFPFHILMSYENLRESRESGGWFSIYSDDQLYLAISDPEAKSRIEAGIPTFVDKYLGDKNKTNRTHWLQPLSDLQFNERYSNFTYKSTSYTVLHSLVMVALFLLLTASINFINLSTALSGKRSKEVGLRKVFGGNRRHIVYQFLSETGLICLFAIFTSLVISNVALKYLNDFLGAKADFAVFQTPSGVAIVLGLWLLVSLTAGFYPSFNLSKLNPVSAIKNQFQTKNSSSYVLRKGLVVFQFMITQFFIIGTMVLVMQMRHLRSADLGFQKEAVVSFSIPERNAEKSTLLAERLRNLNGMETVSLSFTEPASTSTSSTNAIMVESGEEYTVYIKPGDEYFIDTYGLDLLTGENLIKEDTVTRFLATEAFAKKAGFVNPEDMVGTYIKIGGIDAPVTGVVRDFYARSLKSELEPMVIYNNQHLFSTVGMKISGANANLVLAEAEKIFAGLYPEFTFEYIFLDERIAQFYEAEEKLTLLFLIFSLIAVLVGCIGLYGLVSFMAAMKVKEIGVRKVLGASSAQVLGMFSKEYLVLLLTAFVLAAPLATFLMNKWLQDYASKIEISWDLYAFSIVFVALIALLTVGYRSVQAAWSNPVESLKSE
ncbi:ABC transporter permease [Aquiflexum sp.]|uniref:ABC transporter permease n=1 Tax=Aquiflexum sp. TaxID=1872584 RepID=UPI00359465A1